MTPLDVADAIQESIAQGRIVTVCVESVREAVREAQPEGWAYLPDTETGQHAADAWGEDWRLIITGGP